ncbi:MAG: hypothetical protein IJF75_03005 [Clostridia bacterium]|nr:hypothetical protein [Clostridia bacterium]MBQ4122491.1 hypothetical protein [bacterium]
MKKLNLRLSLFLCAFLLFVSVFSLPLSFAMGEVVSTDYSNVLDDLSKDDSIDLNSYSSNSFDYSFKLITLSESSEKEVFVYLVQPSHYSLDLIATSINISLSTDLDFKNYKLKLVSSSGIFDKYLIQDLKVSSKSERYYEISSVFRAFNPDIDKPLENAPDNVVSEVSCSIGQSLLFKDENGSSNVYYRDVEVIEVTDKYVGLIEYNEGFIFFPTWCYSHFVAFSTDMPISSLLSAQVYFTTTDFIQNNFIYDTSTSCEKPIEQYVNLSYTQKGSNQGGGLFSHNYEWDRISSVDSFLESEVTLSDEAKTGISGKDWILRFYETPLQYIVFDTGGFQKYGTLVENVSILRLEFETDGEYYNLGVIDNKQTGSNKPVGSGDFSDKWISIAAIIVIVSLVGIFITSKFKEN